MIVLQRRTHQHLRNINKNPWSEIPYWGTVTTLLGSFIFTKAGQARHDHKHHKQCLCKIISTPGKISERENFFSVNSKIFVLLLVKKVQILKELWCLDAEIGVF